MKAVISRVSIRLEYIKIETPLNTASMATIGSRIDVFLLSITLHITPCVCEYIVIY